MSDEQSYKAYVENIDKFLVPYSSEKQSNQQKFEDCGGTMSPKILFIYLCAFLDHMHKNNKGSGMLKRPK